MFYRIVATSPPTIDDFRSNEAKRKPLSRPTPDRQELWRGLSAYASLERARLTARKYPFHGRFIATLFIDTDSSISVRKTLGFEHYTLWGEPTALLDPVISVTSIE